MTEQTELKGRGIKPMVSLRAHPFLAVAVAVTVLALGAPLAWLKGKPSYMTEATFQVAPRYMKNLREDQEMEFQSNTQYRQFVQHTMRSVTRYDVLADALSSMGEKRSLWQRDTETDRRAIERLRESLIIAAVPDTYLVRVALSGGSKEGLSEVVNAVVSTFLNRMQAEDIYGSDQRTVQLQRREKELLDQIAAKAAQRGEIARSLSLTTFNEGTPNPYDNLVVTLRARVADARHRRIDAEAALAAFESVDDTQITIRSVTDAVLNDPGLNSLKAALLKRRADLLVSISGLKPDHPLRPAVERELSEIDAELKSQSSRLRKEVNTNVRGRLQGTLEQAQQVETKLREDLTLLEAQATEFAGLFQRAMHITSELTQARLELEKVRDRMSYLSVEANSLGFLRLVSKALPADMPMGAGRKKLLLLVLVAAAAAGLLAPTAKDLLDKRLHTVNDFERLMGIPPLGWQVDQRDSATLAFAHEQLRRIVSGLVRARESHDRRVFGFTGIRSGVGTTLTVMDIGRMLKELGFRVLLVEANTFSPDPRFKCERPGLLELLRGQARSSEVIGGRTETEPARVAIGGSGADQIVRLDRLRIALTHWTRMTDFVLVDMPPLLTAADAELIARTVGNAVLVVQAGRTEKGELLRARRTLLRIDPESVGIIVNRVAPFEGGGYLHEQMVESLTRQSALQFFTLPAWRLTWQRWRMEQQLKRRAAKARRAGAPDSSPPLG